MLDLYHKIGNEIVLTIHYGFQFYCQNSGETADDAFRAVFGKEQPGRVRCYGRSLTISYLNKDEEIKNLKQNPADEITSLKE